MGTLARGLLVLSQKLKLRLTLLFSMELMAMLVLAMQDMLVLDMLVMLVLDIGLMLDIHIPMGLMLDGLMPMANKPYLPPFLSEQQYHTQQEGNRCCNNGIKIPLTTSDYLSSAT